MEFFSSANPCKRRQKAKKKKKKKSKHTNSSNKENKQITPFIYSKKQKMWQNNLIIQQIYLNECLSL